MSPYRTLAVTRREPVLAVALARPERQNALTREMIDELHRALDEAEADPAIRMVALSGEGETFCSGMDFAEAGQSGDSAALEPTVEAFFGLMARFTASPVVVVAEVSGRVTAGGVGLVAACDYAIAGADASFQLSEVVFGLLPATVAPFIIRRCGLQPAYRLSLTAQRIGAQEAARIGLVDEVSDKPADALRQLLIRVARVEPDCVGALKGLFRDLWIVDEATRKVTTEAIRRQIMSPSTQAAIRRFVEGTGRWKG